MVAPAKVPEPSLTDAMRLIAAQSRQIGALEARLQRLETLLQPARNPKAPMSHEAWLAQRRELASAARKHRWPKGKGSSKKSGSKTPKNGGKQGSKKGRRKRP